MKVSVCPLSDGNKNQLLYFLYVQGQVLFELSYHYIHLQLERTCPVNV